MATLDARMTTDRCDGGPVVYDADGQIWLLLDLQMSLKVTTTFWNNPITQYEQPKVAATNCLEMDPFDKTTTILLAAIRAASVHPRRQRPKAAVRSGDSRFNPLQKFSFRLASSLGRTMRSRSGDGDGTSAIKVV